jgi:hypothetical protein
LGLHAARSKSIRHVLLPELSPYVVSHILYLESRWIESTYLDCIPHDGLAVLDNEPKVREMGSKYQWLGSHAASNIDNKGALGKAFPRVPCQSDISKSDDGL